MTDIFEQLSAPFPPEAVSWRVGSTTGDKSKGMALAFIDARDVMDRLDTVCGPGGWQCRYPHANGKTVCEIGIKVDGEWVWKADGAGDTDVEKEKGALSDAFKRSAVRWGIGRYLYHLPSPWVALTPAGRSFRIADGEQAKLEKLLRSQEPPSAAVTAAKCAIQLCRSRAALDEWHSENKAVLEMLTAGQRQQVRDAYADHLKTLPKETESA